MKINGTNRVDYVNQAYRKNSDCVNNAEKKAEFFTSKDTIELSKTSKELKRQIENLSTVETTDRQKIDSIKQAIQDGTYRISPEKLAESILDKITEQNNQGEE